jgi:hypothetical protein
MWFQHCQGGREPNPNLTGWTREDLLLVLGEEKKKRDSPSLVSLADFEFE